jgi:hypothetical protein
MNVDRNISPIHNNFKEVRIQQNIFFSEYHFVVLGTFCNRTDDDSLSIISPHFDEYPSGTG